MNVFSRTSEIERLTHRDTHDTASGDFEEIPLRGSFPEALRSRYEDLENVLKALVAYTAPASLATSWSGSHSMEPGSPRETSHHLTSLMDSHNLAEVGQDANVVRTFIEERGVKPITRYRGLSVDGGHGMIMATCCNPLCRAKMPLLAARTLYKSCHHCYTYYCSGTCRLADWGPHKATRCPMARAVSAAKAAIRRILTDEGGHNTFSNLGRGGYLRLGRGCVVIWFDSCGQADAFAATGTRSLVNHPVYVCAKNIEVLTLQYAPQSLSSILQACRTYDPDRSTVINVSVALDLELLRSCTAQMRHDKIHAVKKCLVIPLSKCFLESLASRQTSESQRSTSLLLTKLPGQQLKDPLTFEDRQVIFVNILRQLEAKGVDLRRQYPHMYRNLITFVVDNHHFCPATIYPIDPSIGRAFVCMVAPMSDPVGNEFYRDTSCRSSLCNFMAELDAVEPRWEDAEVTDL